MTKQAELIEFYGGPYDGETLPVIPGCVSWDVPAYKAHDGTLHRYERQALGQECIPVRVSHTRRRLRADPRKSMMVYTGCRDL